MATAAPSTSRSRCNVSARDPWRARFARLVIGLVVLLACACGAPSARAADEVLQLEVVINGMPTQMIGEFVQRDGATLSRPDELAQLGLRIPAGAPLSPDGLVILSAIPGVTLRVETATQMIFLNVAPDLLTPRLLRPATTGAPNVPLESSTGVTLNYDMVGSLTDRRSYGSGLFDLRAFSPIGVASTDVLAYRGLNPLAAGSGRVIRLDSTYVYSNFGAQQRYWLGDFITGGLAWTRPVRLGGAQITRDFTMRPDLVTFPLPTLAGSVAVPSTVDVLVNGTRALSSQVPPGPFQVPQLPLITGAGSVQMTVTNALGQQVTTTLPFYASASLLAPGLHTYSLETGWLRRNWGLLSDDYGAFAASGTYRRGLTDRLTMEIHAEGTKDQLMAGGGIVANAFDFAVVNIAGAASTSRGRTGGELSVGIERLGRKFSFSASAILATPDFRDVAALNGDPVPTREITASASYSMDRWGTLGLAWAQIDRPAAFVPVGIIGAPEFGPPTGTPGLRLLPAQSTRLLTASYSARVFNRAYLFADAFHDFARGGGDSVSVGITIPLGRRSSANASAVSQSGSPAYGQLQVQQSPVDIGDAGYQLYVAGGGVNHEFGELSYKSPWALVSVGVDHFATQTTSRVEARGAFSFADGRLFASNSVNQSFAVVDTGGVGGVHVSYENRPQGATGADGRLLVPDLLSWDVNRLSIDPADVPIDAQVPYVERQVRPPDRSGVVVKFPIRRTNGALLVLVDQTGRPLPVGSMATLEATGVSAPVGYDGQAFVEGLSRQNRVIVQLPSDGRCVVAFPFTPVAGEIPKLGPLTCRNP